MNDDNSDDIETVNDDNSDDIETEFVNAAVEKTVSTERFCLAI